MDKKSGVVGTKAALPNAGVERMVPSGRPRHARAWQRHHVQRVLPKNGEVAAAIIPRAVGIKQPSLNVDCDWPQHDAGKYVQGERALWRAVILQALTDAACESGKYEAKLEREKARRWLLAASAEFVMVCDLAGFDAQQVKKHVRRALAGGCQWRIAPKAGSSAFQRR